MGNEHKIMRLLYVSNPSQWGRGRSGRSISTSCHGIETTRKTRSNFQRQHSDIRRESLHSDIGVEDALMPLMYSWLLSIR